MRIRFLLVTAAGMLGLAAPGALAQAQACTGLCLQQVSCPAGQTTSITGVVYAPNGADPLPNVLVYIPNAPVPAFTPGVSCPVPGTPPLGSPLIGTSTAVDGSFTLTNVPVGTNIPLVIQTGRWRRQLVIPATTACANTAFSTRMPKNQSEGDIPKFAVATGSADEVECVLRKVGIDDAEFTNPGGAGRINLFSGSGSAGARIDPTTPSQRVLMDDLPTLNSYDVLMLPCQGNAFTQSQTSLSNFIQFANAGGRVYSSHFSYVWMYQNPPFSNVAKWDVNQRTLPDGIATVDTSFGEGATLQQWLQLVGASTTPGQIAISTLKHDQDGVVPPTQSWLALNDPADGNPVMQFVFDTPVGATTNQCGRVLFNEYHVESRVTSPTNVAFPAECTSGAMTPQEKLLEYSLFELTDDGGTATLTPLTQDFGSEAVGFTSAAQTFTWTNNSTFPTSISKLSTTGDFSIASNNCVSVPAGSGCQINVVFTPTVLGARTGTLTVGSSGSPLVATLTGNGTPDLSVSVTGVNFGNVDVGTTAAKTLTATNNASAALTFPQLATTGDFAQSSTCGTSLAAHASCTITITFTVATTGPLAGSLTVSSGTPASFGLPVPLTGNGVDFSIAANPASGTVIAGQSVPVNTVLAPIAGFSATVALNCSTTAPASTCVPLATSLVPAGGGTAVTITTTAKYAILGYGGLGMGNWALALIATASAGLLWMRRRGAAGLLQSGLLVLLLTSGACSLSGCSGKAPAANTQYTTPGTYTYTLTATDGVLTHTATFTLAVTE